MGSSGVLEESPAQSSQLASENELQSQLEQIQMQATAAREQLEITLSSDGADPIAQQQGAANNSPSYQAAKRPGLSALRMLKQGRIKRKGPSNRRSSKASVASSAASTQQIDPQE